MIHDSASTPEIIEPCWALITVINYNQLHVLDFQGLETVCSLIITPEVITFPAQLSMSFARPLSKIRDST